MKYNAILDIVTLVEDDINNVLQLEDVKSWLKIDPDYSLDNDLIKLLIGAAIKQIEEYTNTSLRKKNIEVVVCNSQGLCPLPLMPVIEDSDIKAIEVYDRYGNNVTDAAIIQGGFQKYIATPVEDWLKLVYVSGITPLTEIYKTAILNQIAYLYENRGDMKPEIVTTAKLILTPLIRKIC